MRVIEIVGSERYSEVALELWELNTALSDAIRPHIPDTHDLVGELHRYLPEGTELTLNVPGARYYKNAIDPEHLFEREKYYIRTFIDGGCIHKNKYNEWEAQGDTVRRSFFDAMHFLGEHLADRIAAVRKSLGPPPGAGVTYMSAIPRPTPMEIKFITKRPFVLLHEQEGGAFAAFDHCTDRIAMFMRSYYWVLPW